MELTKAGRFAQVNMRWAKSASGRLEGGKEVGKMGLSSVY